MEYKQYNKMNKLNWDQRADIHVDSEFYDIDEFKKNPNRLKSIELNLLKDLDKKKILHLACHIGLDTISLHKKGADVVGVDISDKSIEYARSIARNCGLDTKFIVSDVYDLEKNLDEKDFDYVYISYGVFCWLYDLEKFYKIVIKFLKPGGQLLAIDDHPILNIFDRDVKFNDFNYFQNDPEKYIDGKTYSDQKRKITVENYQWAHTVSDVINSAVKAGFVIQDFSEYPFSFWPVFDNMTEKKNGYRHLKSGDNMPLMFSLLVKKPMI